MLEQKRTNNRQWQNVKLDDICIIVMGQSPPSESYNLEGVGLPFFQGKAEFTELHPKVKKWCSSPKKLAQKNDVLISVRAPVGATNIALEKCAIGRGLAAVSYDRCNKYILFYLRFIERNLEKIGTGTTFKAISGSVLKSQTIPLAPLPEQRAIVAKIEQLFSGLDNGIANLRAAREKLEIYRQAVLKKAFEGDWGKIKLKDVTLKIGSGATPKGGKANYKKSGIPLIRSMNIHFNTFKYRDLAYIDENQAKKLDNVIVKVHDVLLNITGASIGRVNIAPYDMDGGRVNQHVSIVRLDREKLEPKFTKYYIESPKIQIWIKKENYGVTRPALTKSMIENLTVPIPSLHEQQQIVYEIESRLSVCDKLAQSIDDSLNKAEALRQSILKKAFEGRLLSDTELEECRLQPDWEPAEKLLERIKKEKEKK